MSTSQASSSIVWACIFLSLLGCQRTFLCDHGLGGKIISLAKGDFQVFGGGLEHYNDAKRHGRMHLTALCSSSSNSMTWPMDYIGPSHSASYECDKLLEKLVCSAV